jgi:DNA-binding response OmpR family regulator
METVLKIDPAGSKKRLKVLLVEDTLEDARYISLLFCDTPDPPFVVTEWTLDGGLRRMNNGDIDVVLLDLNLPDSKGGIETLRSFRKEFPEAPVVVFTMLEDETTSIEAINEGAQDYLTKGKTDSEVLTRSIRYAFVRQKLITELRAAKEKIMTLTGMMPVCSVCGNISSKEGDWQSLQNYVLNNTEATFKQTLCPDCLVKLYSEDS